jgi:hypothetical protein
MGIHELNCLIARHSADPDNLEAMSWARFYANVRELMQPTEPTAPADDATDDAGREVA